MGFEAWQSGFVQTSTKFKHSKWTGNQWNVFLRCNSNRFDLELLATDKDDRAKLSDLSSAYRLRVCQASKQNSFWLAGSENITHQVCSTAAANYMFISTSGFRGVPSTSSTTSFKFMKSKILSTAVRRTVMPLCFSMSN